MNKSLSEATIDPNINIFHDLEKPKILMVDDRPENLIALKRLLKYMDAELYKAYNGNEALTLTLHHDFALALLDIQMPEMDGYELAGILREEEKTAHLPFIFISAVYTDHLNVFKGYEKGAFSFITKPFQPEILINKVRFFVEKHQQELVLKKLHYSLEQKNEELQNMNKELESFSYSVSHDLRAPLRAINGYAQMLYEDYGTGLDHEGKRLINVISNSAVKMGKLIDEMLSLSRLGHKELNKEVIDMKALTEEVIFEINKLLKHNAQIKLGKLHNIEGDRNLMRQVMFNLITNAVKYSSKKKFPAIEIFSTETATKKTSPPSMKKSVAVPDGRLKSNTFSEENIEEIIFSVRDNGVGFNMEYSNKLFRVFQRLHSQKEFEGIGVGLAIVQRIITKHGGKIWAEGIINEGAIFNFALKKS